MQEQGEATRAADAVHEPDAVCRKPQAKLRVVGLLVRAVQRVRVEVAVLFAAFRGAGVGWKVVAGPSGSARNGP